MLATIKKKTPKDSYKEEQEHKFLLPFLTHFGGRGWEHESPCGNKDNNAAVDQDYLKVTCKKCREVLKNYMH